MPMVDLHRVDAARVIRQDNMRGCRLYLPDGTTRQIPKVYRWLLVLQLVAPDSIHPKLTGYELHQN